MKRNHMLFVAGIILCCGLIDYSMRSQRAKKNENVKQTILMDLEKLENNPNLYAYQIKEITEHTNNLKNRFSKERLEAVKKALRAMKDDIETDVPHIKATKNNKLALPNITQAIKTLDKATR